MANPGRRVTLRDIAKVARCHYTSVSLALRNDSRLPEPTRRRLRAVAERLGYVPDPMLASLCQYRSRLRPQAFHATIAWLTNHPTRHGWRDVKVFAEYHTGAVERGRTLGYRVEEFWLGEPGMSLARAAQILAARGIGGIIVAPQPEPAVRIELDWARFSAVAIGYSLSFPQLHVVCANQFRAIRHAMLELGARGYRRPGLVMLANSDERVEHNWTGGYTTAQQPLNRRDRLPPLLLPAWDDRAFAAWRAAHQPDVIITKCDEVAGALQRLRLRVPRDIGLAYLTLAEPHADRSGMDENPRRVGAAALEYVAAMWQRSEHGLPALPQQLLVEASWIEGRTVRPRIEAAEKAPGYSTM